MLNGIIERGMECSDMSSFYSSVKGGLRAAEQFGIVRMAHGRFRLREIQEGNRFGYELYTYDLTWLYDIVVRYVVKQDKGWAMINNEELAPIDMKYHQWPVRECKAEGLRFRVVESIIPDDFRQEMYIRAEGGNWVVHARAMSYHYHLLVLKHTDGTSKVWYGTEAERIALWRRRELDAPVYDTQIQPHCLVPADTTIRIVVEVNKCPKT